MRELPSALAQTTETLGKVETFAEVLAPASERLRPAVRALDRANAATPAVRARGRAAAAATTSGRSCASCGRWCASSTRRPHDLARPTRRSSAPCTSSTGCSTCSAFNPGGREGPDTKDREEGYLFHLAWLSHTSVSLFSGQDANGIFRPLVLGGTCNVLSNTAASAPESEFLLGLSGVLNDPAVCGGELTP